ncbi:hypothetical protein [Actinomadura sp. 3N508]|uniref:deazapurine DNA modification protein DpdA family protein n=1 Tax=Actinomadura sp. 3N508 TaxID=3375153 RepID=UPI0037A61925
MLIVYLTTHMDEWLHLDQPGMPPLFVSHRRLARRLASRRPLRPAVKGWALDSGGFSELDLYRGWKTTPAEYVAAVHRYDTEIGQLAWAASQDWMCEPDKLAKTGLTVREHQARTVANFVELTRLWADVSDEDCPFMPTLQGWTLADFLTCWDMYGDAGVDLTWQAVVGLGSVCRRERVEEVGDILLALRDLDPELPIHAFGFKTVGVRRYADLMDTCDSGAWSKGGRKRPDPVCPKRSCSNCLHYALDWYARVTGSLAFIPDPIQRSIFPASTLDAAAGPTP